MSLTDAEKEQRGALFEAALKDAGLNQSEFARELGIKPQSVQQYVTGKTAPRGHRLKKIRELLGRSLDEIFAGTRSQGAAEFPMQPGAQRIPVLDWQDAGVSSGTAISWRIENNVGPRSFALRVPGESMASGPVPITEGSIITVDPDIDFKNIPASTPAFVVARLADSNIVLRQVTRDGSQYFLKTSKSGYPLIPLDENCIILGVVRRVTIEL